VTTPPFDPTTPEPGPAGSPTQPYPTFSPAAPEPDLVPVSPSPVSASPVSPAPVRRGSAGSSRVLNLALGLAVLVAVGGVAFAVGRATAPVTAGAATVIGQNGTGTRGNGLPGGSFDPDASQRPGGFTGRGGFGGLGGGLVIEGTVESIAADSVTIKMADGTTVTVGLDATTTYHSAAPATASDVTAGATVKLQVTGGLRPGANGNSNGNGGAVTLGTAGDITIVP
jgi:hypothetical protein